MTTQDKLADARTLIAQMVSALKGARSYTDRLRTQVEIDRVIVEGNTFLAEHDAQSAPAPVQVDGLPVAWRFWVDDPTSALMPHWTGWSADAGFRGLCEKLGHRAEFAYAIAATAADGAGELSQGVADARVGQYAVRELPGKWRKNATELGRSSDPKGIWNDTLMTCADELESALASHQESRNAN